MESTDMRAEDLGAGQRELLARADRSYRLMIQSRRRLALFAIVAAVMFAIGAVSFGARHFEARDAAQAVEDRLLFDAFGIQIADPEPALLRIELNARATINGYLALMFAAGAALWLLAAGLAWPGRDGAAADEPRAVSEAGAVSAPRSPPAAR